MGKKILLLAGDYVEDYEAMMPFQSLEARKVLEHRPRNWAVALPRPAA